MTKSKRKLKKKIKKKKRNKNASGYNDFLQKTFDMMATRKDYSNFRHDFASHRIACAENASVKPTSCKSHFPANSQIFCFDGNRMKL